MAMLDQGRGTRQRLSPPVLAGIAAAYLLMGLLLAHTAYIALQSRSSSSAGLQASVQFINDFKEFKEELRELHQLVDTALNSSNSRGASSTPQTAEHLAAVSRAQDEQHQLTAVASASSANFQVADAELHHIATHGNVCDKQAAAGLSLNVTPNLVAPLVIMAHNRPGYLAKSLVSLLKFWSADPSYAEKFPLFISVDAADGDDQRTLLVAAALHEATGAQVIKRRRDGGPHCAKADCHISQHFKLILQLFLQCHKAPGILFLEEDLEVAPDFFTYFEATAPLMQRDETVLCVSAWNDHGQRGRAKDHLALYRTDVMPGLGWYVNSAIGLELAKIWPLTNWDDFLRLAHIRKGRSCIFPEVSRTHNYGRVGVHSHGPGFETHLGSMLLNDQPVAWKDKNLDFLLQSNYSALYNGWLDSAEVWKGTLLELQSYCAIEQPDDEANPGDFVYRYPAGKLGYEEAARHLMPMKGDVREGTPRASWRGHVVVRCRGRRLFLRAV